jgi:hypothetical protein
MASIPWAVLYSPLNHTIKVRSKTYIQTQLLIWCQGFSNDDNVLRGTYADSWTWFEAAIHPSQSSKSSSSLRYPPPRRHVQANVHAIFEFKVHINTWDYQDKDVEKQAWLRFLRPGDIVQLIPRAKYRAWVNYIKRAEIEVFDGDPT